MIGNFRNIHIGSLVAQRMKECGIDLERAAKFIDVSVMEIEQMFTLKSLDSHVLLRWCKLLKYDFFRIYSQHLILYAPQHRSKIEKNNDEKESESLLPVFKKHIYTQEIIEYLVELVDTGQKTARDIQIDYNIPATTVLRWIDKTKKKNEQ